MSVSRQRLLRSRLSIFRNQRGGEASGEDDEEEDRGDRLRLRLCLLLLGVLWSRMLVVVWADSPTGSGCGLGSGDGGPPLLFFGRPISGVHVLID